MPTIKETLKYFPRSLLETVAKVLPMLTGGKEPIPTTKEGWKTKLGEIKKGFTPKGLREQEKALLAGKGLTPERKELLTGVSPVIGGIKFTGPGVNPDLARKVLGVGKKATEKQIKKAFDVVVHDPKLRSRIVGLTKGTKWQPAIGKELNLIQSARTTLLNQLKGVVSVPVTPKALPAAKPVPITVKPARVIPVSSPKVIPPLATKTTVDPIAKLSTLIKQAKPLRATVEKAYTAERAVRIAKVDQFIRDTIDNVGGEEGYKQVLGKLKGELISPEAKVRFEPVKNKLTEEEIKSLYIGTWKHPYLDNWEKISVADGLTNLLQGGLPQPKQLVLLEEVYGSDLIKNILSKRVWGAKATDFAVEAANIPRALLATADMSGFLRQGVIQIPAHPVISAKAIAKTFQFVFSPKSFEQYFKDLPKDPLYPLMRKSKLAITDPVKAGMIEREEAFMSRLLQNIPIINIPITAAERAYVGFLNKLRVDVFKNWADEFLSKGLSPIKDADVFKSAANVTNTFTGRGSLGKLNRVAPSLNILFFSSRLISARFNALNPVWYAKMPPVVRKKALGDFAKFVVAGLTTLSTIWMYKKATGASDEELSIEPDPRSSDFGKIKMGNTRWDIWGGFQQWARVFAQVTTGERKNTSTGEIISLNKDEYPFTTRKEVLLRFIEGKLAPVPALVNELISGAKTFTGEDITARTVARDKLIPMYIQDIADAYNEGGLGRAVGAGVPAFFGVGVQTWEEQKRILPTPGLPMKELLPMPGINTKLPAMPGI